MRVSKNPPGSRNHVHGQSDGRDAGARDLRNWRALPRHEPVKSDSDFDRETRALAEAVLRRDDCSDGICWNNPRRLRIRTIDSVCGEVAQSLPVLSGEWRPADSSRRSDVRCIVKRRDETLMQLGGNDAELDAALRTVLLHRDGSLATASGC